MQIILKLSYKCIEIILLCVAFLLLGACASVKTGPVTLTVTDHETGLPIPDITVYYEVEKLRPVWFIEVDYINIDLRKLKTDSNGEIKIPAKKYFLPAYEELHTRGFYINVDIKDNRMPNEMEIESMKLYLNYNPIKLGDVIYSRNMYYGDTDIIYPNNKYSAARVVIWDYEDETILNDGVFIYHIFAPFIDNEMRIAVELARNDPGDAP
jgi:hypothetical protein